MSLWSPFLAPPFATFKPYLTMNKDHTTTTATATLYNLHRNPLDLQEILTIVAHWLREDRASLKSCLCVSKGFHRAFAPHVWRHLVLDCPQLIPLDVVATHAHYVQSLTFKSILPSEYKDMQFPRLNHLLLGESMDPKWTLEDCFAIVRTHKNTIESLAMALGFDCENNDEFWRDVGDIQALRQLNVNTIIMEGLEKTRLFWDLCENRLTALVLTNGGIVTPKTLEAGLGKEEAQSLLERVSISFVHFDNPAWDRFIHLLRRSRNLRSLSLSTLFISPTLNADQLFPLAPVAQLLWDKPLGLLWPFLTVLHLSQSHLTDAQLGMTLKSFSTGLKDLNIQESEFGALSMQALLLRHAKTLMHLTILECDLFESAMMIEVLCSCPRLLSVSGNGLLASDIVKSLERPWVCCSLQEWNLVVYRDVKGQEKLIVKKLSMLEKVKTHGPPLPVWADWIVTPS